MKELDIPFREPDIQSAGSSDVGNVSWQCPAFHPSMALSDHYFACHTEDMVQAVKSPACRPGIVLGARVMGHTLLRFMTDPDLMKRIREDFGKEQ